MSPRFRHRTTKKESRRWPRPTAAALEERIDEIIDRVARAGDDHVERAAVLEEYLTLARAHDGETWFDAGAWSEELADSYLALGFRSRRTCGGHPARPQVRRLRNPSAR